MSTVFATRTNTILATIRSTIVSTIKIPDDLFKNGEAGTFLDFRPEYTYTDTAGTVPAGAGDFIANAGDRSPNGADAVQATSAARARLSAGYNLLESTEKFDNPYWLPQSCTITPDQAAAPDGTVTADLFSGSADGAYIITPAIDLPVGSYSLKLRVKGFGPSIGSTVRLWLWHVGGSAGDPDRITVTLTDEWQTIESNPTITTVGGPRVRIDTTDHQNPFYIWGADLRLASDTDKPAYQRVGDLTADPGDYDTAGFPYYADLDLTDDVYPVTLPAITGGQIALVGRNGYYIETLNYAGGTFEIGPTTYTGGPAGVIDLLGGLLAVAIVDRAFTAAERSALIQWGIARGAQNEDLNP